MKQVGHMNEYMEMVIRVFVGDVVMIAAGDGGEVEFVHLLT